MRNEVGQLEESLALLLSTVDAYQSVFGAGHDRTISSRRILARVYRQLGQKDDALAQLEEAQKSLATGSSPPSETLEKIRKEIEALQFLVSLPIKRRKMLRGTKSVFAHGV